MWFWIVTLTGLVSLLLFQKQVTNHALQSDVFFNVRQFRATYKEPATACLNEALQRNMLNYSY